MCGIVGLVDYSGVKTLSDTIQHMKSRIAHRGPNGEGTLVRENVALGHTRLSIIDPLLGAQPMEAAEGRLVLTFNGEVYNYKEIRKILVGKGHQFETNSDTEVVLKAYQHWGVRCLDWLQGMFAFGILDLHQHRLFLARDRFGVKPLLYRLSDTSFSFSSEFPPFRELDEFEAEIDLAAIDTFLRLQYIPAPATAYRKIKKLPAGHCMVVSLEQPCVEIWRYWNPDFSNKVKRSRKDLIRELDFVLRDSVKRHMVADVKFGALLSGGIDSSLVVSYMAEILEEPLETFSIGFEEASVNELGYAKAVATRYSTNHYSDLVRFDALNALDHLVPHYGEPFGDQSALATWHLSKLASERVPMVLSGDGADEIFAGYGTYRGWYPRDEGRAFRGWRRLVSSREPAPALPSHEEVSKWMGYVQRFDHRSRSDLWRPELRFLSDLPDSAVGDAFDESVFEGVNRVQFVDMKTFLPEDIMTKVDVASMYYGLEVRPPFLDQAVFEFASSIPAEDLVSPDRTSGKLPLKLLAAEKFGEDFVGRRKQGFELPLASWLSDKAGIDYLEERLLESKILEWFEPVVVKSVIHSDRHVNKWLLLILDRWLSA